MPTLFQSLAELCEKLESAKKRKPMVLWVASFILNAEATEIGPAVSMLLGRVFPKWDQRKLEVSWATINAAIMKLAGSSGAKFSEAFRQTGDVGDATRIIFQNAQISRQSTLFEKQLSILEVKHAFESISRAKGAGSREKKERILETLLRNSTPLEAKYVVRILLGEMRTGFSEGLMEQAISQAFDVPLEVVQTASMLTGDTGDVASLAMAKGKEYLWKIRFKIFRPIKPMLAQTATSLAEALSIHGGKTALEYKLDGARIQIHKSESYTKVYSRSLTDVTASLPEIAALVQEEVKGDEVILEGEVIAVGKNGDPMPFQHLMRRFRRTRRIEHAQEEIPVQLHLFDLIYLDGKSYINEVYSRRRAKLCEVAGAIQVTKQIVARNVYIAESFFKEAVQVGHEGLMAKKVDGLYTPGVRGKKWLKIKEILEPLDLAIIAAEYGYGRRHGWLSDYHLAALDSDTGELAPIGKTFKGLTDAEIIEVTRKLEELAIRRNGSKVLVDPKIVVEVSYNEIQESSKYKSGMALRFARITRIRHDKSLDEVDTLQKVKRIFETQFEKKARYARAQKEGSTGK